MQSEGEKLRELRQRRQSLQQKRDLVNSAAAHRDDVKAMLGRWASARRAAYAADLRTSITPFIRRPYLTTPEAEKMQPFSAVAASVGLGQDSAASTVQIDTLICALMGDAVVQTLCAEVDAMPWPEEGLRLAERPAALAKLDKEIGELTTKIVAIEQQFDDNGLPIPD